MLGILLYQIFKICLCFSLYINLLNGNYAFPNVSPIVSLCNLRFVFFLSFVCCSEISDRSHAQKAFSFPFVPVNLDNLQYHGTHHHHQQAHRHHPLLPFSSSVAPSLSHTHSPSLYFAAKWCIMGEGRGLKRQWSKLAIFLNGEHSTRP